MVCNQTGGTDIEYTYKLKNDISTIRGGFTVLRDLHYPDEILQKLVLSNSFV